MSDPLRTINCFGFEVIARFLSLVRYAPHSTRDQRDLSKVLERETEREVDWLGHFFKKTYVTIEITLDEQFVAIKFVMYSKWVPPTPLIYRVVICGHSLGAALSTNFLVPLTSVIELLIL